MFANHRQGAVSQLGLFATVAVLGMYLFTAGVLVKTYTRIAPPSTQCQVVCATPTPAPAAPAKG